MTAIGVFPIKRRSRRCPEKNFQDLGGVELWEWSFRAMLAAMADGPLDRIVVSACPDVAEYRKPCRVCGGSGKALVGGRSGGGTPHPFGEITCTACMGNGQGPSFIRRVQILISAAGVDQDRVIFLPRESLCGDDDTAHQFLYWIDQQMRERAGVKDDDIYIFTHPCNPFVTQGLMKVVHDRVLGSTVNMGKRLVHRSSIAVTELHQKLWEKNERGESRPVNHEPFRMVPTQDLKTLFVETVAMYGYTSATIHQLKSHHGFYPDLWVCDPVTLWDIDEPWELEVARAIVETGRRKMAFGVLKE